MKAYLKVIGILLLPLAFVIWYANSPVQIPPPGWKLSKAKPHLNALVKEESPNRQGPTEKEKETSTTSMSRKSSKTSKTSKPSTANQAKEASPCLPDTSSHRILFFGDSMVEGLLRRMNCYAFANGHKMTNVVWYSSTTEIWAQTDTLRYFINNVQPTFAMISIGANEQFVKDAAGREAYIRQILKELGDIPFIWIGVPAWKEDTGINELTKRVVGESRYFDSRGLTLQRGRDRMHPTFYAASCWMDSVAVWMASPATAHPIRMDKPTDGRKHTYKTYALQPMRN